MNEPTPHQPETVDPTPNGPKPASGTNPNSESSFSDSNTIPFTEEDDRKDEVPAPLPMTIPGYEILGVLGRGGMGVVYKARETALDRLVALKVVTAGSHASAEQLTRFRAEARAEARLQHAHIVQVHAVGEHAGFPFLSLEYMDGGSLAQLLLHQPQPPREAAHLIYLLARAMAYAHQRGIIHRDLKPANILLHQRVVLASASSTSPKTRERTESSSPSLPSSSDARDTWLGAVPKIADFGLAKCLEDEAGHTRTGSLMGTPSYMAPEQAEGRKDIGPATDIWALGVILYELLVGRTPFQGVTMVDTLEQVRMREPVPPTQLQPKVPTDLETICLKCLRKEISQRYTSAEELAEDLRRFLSGEPILARPIGSLERGLRWCRRNPKLAGLSATVLVLLLTIAVVSTVFVFVLNARAKEIERNEKIAREEKERADEHAREAFQRYQLLHEALTVVIDRVQKDLKVFPETSAVRKQILEATMKVLRQSIEQSSDSTRQPERSLASAHMIMGDILLEQRNKEEAYQHYEKCHDILKGLYEANPQNDKAAGNYAASLSRLGDVALDRKDPTTALKLYRQALQLQENSLAHPPDPPELTPTEIRRAIANSQQRLGEILTSIQPPSLSEARAYFEKARDNLEQVLPREDTLGNHLRAKQVSLKLGQINERLGREEEARKAFERCLAACKKLADANPADVEDPILIVRLSGKVGDMYLFAGDTPKAKSLYQEAVVRSEQLVRRDNQPGLRVLLSLNYYRRATAYLRQGDNNQADKDYRKCLDLRVELCQQIPNNLDLQIDRMIAQGRCGLHREASAFAHELRQRFAEKPDKLLHSACGYALCVFGIGRGKSEGALSADEIRLRKEYTQHAIEALRQAKAKDYNDLHNLQIEPDLDPIRQDKGFQDLLREFAAGSGR